MPICICINNIGKHITGHEFEIPLTIGKKYNHLPNGDVMCDDGRYRNLPIRLFMTIEDYRNMKIGNFVNSVDNIL